MCVFRGNCGSSGKIAVSDMAADSTTALWAAVQNERTAFAYVEGTHTHTTVAHFCSYGASYYRYLVLGFSTLILASA
jgi:hypothetical protein